MDRRRRAGSARRSRRISVTAAARRRRHPRPRLVPDPRVRGTLHRHRPPIRSSVGPASTSGPRSTTPSPIWPRQPADDLAFERIVNEPKRGLGDKASRLFIACSRDAEPLRSPPPRCSTATNSVSPQQPRPLRPRHRPLAADGRRTAAPRARPILLDESGYTACSRPTHAEAAGRLDNLAELVPRDGGRSLGAFLEHVSLVMDNDRAGRRQAHIMTIHAAKGLEFPIVYLAGWEEGVFPSQRSLDEGGLASLEEERRLAYVAITRARGRRPSSTPPIAGSTANGPAASRAASSPSYPSDQIQEETTMSGGESLWRPWSERAYPFAHVARPAPGARLSTRGPRTRLRARAETFTPPRPAADRRGPRLGRQPRQQGPRRSFHRPARVPRQIRLRNHRS